MCHLDAAEDDQEDRPCDAHEAHRQNADGSQKEIQTDQDKDDRQCFMMGALAHFALRVLFVHCDNVKNSTRVFDLWITFSSL
jgi:hypothetical protein